jgi:hypothetical protein
MGNAGGPAPVQSPVLTKIESRVVRQPDSRVRRAWYQSATADVLLLHDADTGEFLSFEIDWEGRSGVQRSYVTWARGIGIRSGRVDTGEGEGALQYKAAPVVVWDFKINPHLVTEARRLIDRSCIEEGLRESVLKRLVV